MATLFAVNHYTEMARAAMAMAPDVPKRPAFDPDSGAYMGHDMDPRSPCECCDEVLTEDEARGEAQDQILSHAESVADWLAKACDTPAGRMPLDVTPLTPLQIMEGTPALLLTVLMNGDNTQALRALHQLRELAAVAFADQIKERAGELLRAAVAA